MQNFSGSFPKTTAEKLQYFTNLKVCMWNVLHAVWEKLRYTFNRQLAKPSVTLLKKIPITMRKVPNGPFSKSYHKMVSNYHKMVSNYSFLHTQNMVLIRDTKNPTRAISPFQHTLLDRCSPRGNASLMFIKSMHILTWQPRPFAQTLCHGPAVEKEIISSLPN